MKIDVKKEQIYERKADGSGRISLPSKKFAGKKVEVVVTDVIEEDGNES